MPRLLFPELTPAPLPGGDVQVSGLLCACSASAVGGGCQPHTLRARVMLPRAAGCLCRKMAPGLVGAASPLVWAACSASRHAPLPGRTQDPRRLCWGIAGPQGPGWGRQRKQKARRKAVLHLGSLCLDRIPADGTSRSPCAGAGQREDRALCVLRHGHACTGNVEFLKVGKAWKLKASVWNSWAWSPRSGRSRACYKHMAQTPLPANMGQAPIGFQ